MNIKKQPTQPKPKPPTPSKKTNPEPNKNDKTANPTNNNKKTKKKTRKTLTYIPQNKGTGEVGRTQLKSFPVNLLAVPLWGLTSGRMYN